MFAGFALGAALGSLTIAHVSPAALGFVGASSIVAGLILSHNQGEDGTSRVSDEQL
jgi:predicted MFS family arabinose efflux permease